MRHHHIFHHLAKEINDHCQEMIITECYSQEKHVLTMHCETQDGKQHAHIEWSMHTASPIVMLKENIHRARNNSVDLLPEIIGRKILSCMKHPTDRIIFLRLTGASVIGQFFGGSNTALFVVDDEDRIIDSFKRSPLPSGEIYLSMISHIPSLIDIAPESRLLDAIQKAGNCGKLYAQEIFSRFVKKHPHIQPHQSLQSLTDVEYEDLHVCHQEIMDASMHSSTAYILEMEDHSLALSCLPLCNSIREIWSGTSMSEAIRRYQGLSQKHLRFVKLRAEIEEELIHQREKIEQTIAHITDEEKSQQRIQEAHQIATLLLANPYPALRVNDDTIELLDEGLKIAIPAFKGKTYAEHAEYYFKKAKNARERMELRKKTLPDLRLRLEQLIAMQRTLSDSPDIRMIETMLKQVKGDAYKLQEKQAQTAFREFTLNKQYVLYVGRNAQNNDQLTTKFAKPNDVWLHARGVSGSHAILRGPAHPPKHILEVACEIAAYFSKSRKGTFVPVAYALKKYVRKPKGAGPGSVVMEREEVLMVEPRLPDAFKEI
jgi:predicted ribosome quality control (RQC) complex YloA/Tae2 family protein